VIWSVVAFGDSKLSWLRWLKPGFRHCFVAVETEVGWIAYDPLLHHAKIGFVPIHPDTPASALADDYLVHGMNAAAVCVVPEPPERFRLPMPLTCVEAVKHVLAIRRPFLLTPWQLWQYIKGSDLAVYAVEN